MNLDLRDLAMHRSIAGLIAALDRADFWPLLARVLRHYVHCDNWVALMFSRNAKPEVFVENPSDDGTPDPLFHDYLNGLYLFDPFFIASRERSQSGLFLLDEVAPDNFLLTDYYRLYFKLNVVADEIQFNVSIATGRTLCFSLGRGSKYSAEDVAFLHVLAPSIIALMRKRYAYEAGKDGSIPRADGRALPVDEMEDAFSRIGGRRLTGREAEIGHLMLAGFSSKNIAEKLKISVETVRAHRKHIYSKLQINSQSELFASFYAAQAGGRAPR
ncbi:MAG: helix-turn-helix transcriptional regulator [Pseudomonadota bacterium]